MNICVGIISYFPDNDTLRLTRMNTFIQLIDKCNLCFDIPIFVIAQNYTDEEKELICSKKNIVLYEHPKLGITGARKELRKVFLESGYDYLIMLDDDCIIRGKPEEGKKYLEELKAHPGGYAAKRKRLLKLFAISKEIYSEMDMPDVKPEENEGYEDAIFTETLRTKYPFREFVFRNHLVEFSDSSTDPNSTWRNECKKTLNRKLLSERTTLAIHRAKGLRK